MSRLDTQGDRLVRGPDPFQNRTNIEPVRIAPQRKDTLTQLIAATAQAAGVVGQVVEKNDKRNAKIKDGQDRAEINNLLELQNKAEANPEIDGPIFATAYTKAVQGSDPKSVHRTNILQFDAHNRIEGYNESQRANDDKVFFAKMDKNYVNIGLTFDPTEQRYIDMPQSERDIVIENEILEDYAALEGGQDIINKLATDDTFAALHRRQIRSISSKYDQSNFEKSKLVTDKRNEDISSGVAMAYLSNPEADFRALSDSAASATFKNPDVQDSEILNSIITRLKLNVEGGGTTKEQIVRDYNRLTDLAKTLGPEAEIAAANATDGFIAQVSESAKRDAETAYDDKISAGGTPTDALNAANAVYIVSLEETTGSDFDVNTPVDKIDAGLGLSQRIAKDLSKAYAEREAETKARNRVTTDVIPSNTLQGTVSSGSLASLNYNGGKGDPAMFDNSILRTGVTQERLDSTPDEQLAQFAASREMRYIAMNFSRSPDRADHLVEAMENGGNNGLLYTVDGLTELRSTEATAFLRDLPPEQAHALKQVREQGLLLADADTGLYTQDDQDKISEIYLESIQKYDEVASASGSVGTGKSTEGLDVSKRAEKKMTKANKRSLTRFRGTQDLPTDGRYSEDAKNIIIMEMTRIDRAAVGQKVSVEDMAASLESAIGAEYTSYFNVDSGEFNLVKDIEGIRPETHGLTHIDMVDALGSRPPTLGTVVHNSILPVVFGLSKLTPVGDVPFIPADKRKEGNQLSDAVQFLVHQNTTPDDRFILDKSVTSVPEVVSGLLMNEINKTLEVKVTQEQVVDMFDTRPGTPSNLQLVVRNGFLSATGRVNGVEISPETYITLLEWDKSLFGLVGLERKDATLRPEAESFTPLSQEDELAAAQLTAFPPTP